MVVGLLDNLEAGADLVVRLGVHMQWLGVGVEDNQTECSYDINDRSAMISLSARGSRGYFSYSDSDILPNRISWFSWGELFSKLTW